MNQKLCLTIGAILISMTAADGALAQSATLSERIDAIGACRSTENVLTVFSNSGLTQSVGQVPANSRVALTGVFSPSSAQIQSPRVGWLASAPLKLCDDAGTLPPDIDTNPIYCRRLRNSREDGPNFAYLDRGLVARETPNGTVQTSGGQNDGPAGRARVRVTANPPQVQDAGDFRWVRVKYIGLAGRSRVGWISNGARGQNTNLANCPNGNS